MSLIGTLQFVVNHPLNRDRRARALLGFLKWQIGSRLVPGPVVMEWVAGARMIVRPGDTGMTQNVYCGLQDFEDMTYMLHVLGSEDLFVDVGANVGAYTVLACAAREVRGYCFEPVPSTFRRLLDNLVVNNLSSRVSALNIGLSSEEGKLTFTDSENCTNHVITEGDNQGNSVTVQVRKLDSVLRDESPTMLKIDVEGFETAVLDGAEATLNNPSLHSVLMELNGSGSRYGFDENRILRKMSDFGFATYAYDPFTRDLHRLPGKNAAGNNTLFLRNEDAIRERISTAPRISIRSHEL
jgi:FkbM family methyltransferase